MSQDVKDKSKAAEVRTEETRGFIREVRRAARRKYSPEEKIRIVLEGFRREDTVRDATREEVERLKRENQDLKQLVAELSLDVHRFKKTAIPPLLGEEGTSV